MTNPVIKVGDVWRSPRSWWRITEIETGKVWLEGPRGWKREPHPLDGTPRDPLKTMELCGFLAWIRKTGAILDHQGDA